jgi:hypothetical protein
MELALLPYLIILNKSAIRQMGSYTWRTTATTLSGPSQQLVGKHSASVALLIFMLLKTQEL